MASKNRHSRDTGDSGYKIQNKTEKHNTKK